jgi:septal ring factor EnvC (AmiA/AmiB activator)
MSTGEVSQVSPSSGRSNGLLYSLAALLLCATAVSLWYLSRERQQAHDLAATNQALSASLTQVETQLQSVTDRLNSLSAHRPAAVGAQAPPRPKAKSSVATAKRAPAVRPADDSRFKEIQGRLSDQEKQIASARDDLSKTREDLQGSLDSTRDELSGSIARTHDEVVALQKRGESDYFEFTLDKSKQFHRVGPVSVLLRKANVKHKSYDITLLVDDIQLQKKSVNLFEPVWVNLADHSRPLELVVNKIDKDHIQGYVTEPKYKQSELSANASTAKPVTSLVQP